MTTKKPQVYKAIAAVTKALGEKGISKDKQNTQQKYKFRGVEDVYKALNPLLAEHGLVILPRVISRETNRVVTFKEWNGQKKESALNYTYIKVEFDFVSTDDGSKHTACTVGEAMDSGDKSHNKAMSAAYKYVAFLTFCIPTEGLQEDSEQDTYTVTPAQQPPIQQLPQQTVPNAEFTSVMAEIKDVCIRLSITPHKLIAHLGLPEDLKHYQAKALLASAQDLYTRFTSGGLTTKEQKLLGLEGTQAA